ncbi:MAG: hypothetical protein ABI467_09970 [Kofleriaceae bacterium]
MRTLAIVLLFAACGSSGNGGEDGGNKPADARVFQDAPPNVPAMITIGGTALDNKASGPPVPLPGVAIALLRVSDDSMIATATSDAQGKYSMTVTTSGHVVDAYLEATISGYAPAAVFPAAPFQQDTPDADSNLITTANYAGLQFISGQQAGMGFVVVGILDANAMAVAGAKVSSTPAGVYKYSDSNGTPTGTTSTNTDGAAFFTNLAPGMVTISATKSGATFKSHAIKAAADTFTSSVLTE